MTRVSLALTLAVATTPCNAQPPLTPEPDRSSVDTLAAAIGAQVRAALGEHRGGDLALDVRSDLPATARGPGLTDALSGPWLASLRAEPRWRSWADVHHDASEVVAARRAATDGYEAFVQVRVRLQGNFLYVEGGVWSTSREGWRDRLSFRPLRLGTLFARMRLDAELRQYVGALARVSEENVTMRTAELPARGYVAMGSADLDGDGRTEIVLARADRVEVVRVASTRSGLLRSEPLARLAFPADTPTAPARRRRVVASARSEAGSVLLRTSDHAVSFRVEWQDDRAVLVRAEGPCGADQFPLQDACGRLADGRDFFDPTVVRQGAEHETPGSFYTRSARRLRTPEGGRRSYEAIVTPHGRLAVRVDEHPIGAAGYGAALALADLDDDGDAELMTSSAQPIGAGDQLTLLRVLPRGALHVVWRSPALAGSVVVSSAADVDDDGLEEMLAIEEPADAGSRARLWLVR